MAYENYKFVSWTAGTPITGERLGQMSTNIEETKNDAESKPAGIISFYQLTANVPNSVGWTDVTEHEIIYLRNEAAFSNNAIDNRVTVSQSRFLKLSFNIPAIRILNKGAEDSTFSLKVYKGSNLAASPALIGQFLISPHTFSYINVASNVNANIANETVRSSSFPTAIGGGTYSVVLTTLEPISNAEYFVSIIRSVGASSNNAPAYYVQGGPAAAIQMWVEDVGAL